MLKYLHQSNGKSIPRTFLQSFSRPVRIYCNTTNINHIMTLYMNDLSESGIKKKSSEAHGFLSLLSDVEYCSFTSYFLFDTQYVGLKIMTML